MIYPYLEGTTILNDLELERSVLYECQRNVKLLSVLEKEDFSDETLGKLLGLMVMDTDCLNISRTNEAVEKSSLPEWAKMYGWLEYLNKADYKGPWEQMFVNLRLLRLRRDAKNFKSSADDLGIPQEFIQMANDLARLVPNNNDVQSIIESMGIPMKTIQTGYSLLDDNGGIPNGSVLVIASETSVGKTTLALNMMSRFLQKGLSVHYVTLEMPAPLIAQRLLQVRHDCSANEALEARDVLEEYVATLSIDDRKTKFADILASMSSKNCDIHIIDHLHIINYGKDAWGRVAEIEDMTRQFKQFAQSNNKVVIILSQLNRDVSKLSRAPQLSDLRGSGSIEQDADIVTMLHDPNRRDDEESLSVVQQRKKVTNIANDLEGKTENGDRLWYIRKNRHGPLGMQTLGFNTTSLTFYEKL